METTEKKSIIVCDDQRKELYIKDVGNLKDDEETILLYGQCNMQFDIKRWYWTLCEMSVSVQEQSNSNS